jgi:hypothetical protein
LRGHCSREEKLMAESFKQVLEGWVGKKATVVNPSSFQKTALREHVGLETYEVEISHVGDDFVQVGFDSKKTDHPEHVDQYIPFHDIRRLSVWGDERYIQL